MVDAVDSVPPSEMDPGKENAPPPAPDAAAEAPAPKAPVSPDRGAAPLPDAPPAPAPPAEVDDFEEELNFDEPDAAPAAPARKFSRLKKVGVAGSDGPEPEPTSKFVQCDKCDKWREVNIGADTEGEWECKLNSFEEAYANCEAGLSPSVEKFLADDNSEGEEEGDGEEDDEEMPVRRMYDDNGEIENEEALIELYAGEGADDEEEDDEDGYDVDIDANTKLPGDPSAKDMAGQRKALNATTQRLLRETATTACIGKGKEIKIQSLGKSSVLAKLQAKKAAMSASAPRAPAPKKVSLADLPEGVPVLLDEEMEDGDDYLIVAPPAPVPEAEEAAPAPGVSFAVGEGATGPVPLPRTDSQSQDDSGAAEPPPPPSKVHPMFAAASMKLKLDETQAEETQMEDDAGVDADEGAGGVGAEVAEGAEGVGADEEDEEVEISGGGDAEGEAEDEEEEEEENEEELEGLSEEERAARRAAIKAARAADKQRNKAIGALGGLVDDEAEMSDDEGHSDDEPADDDLDKEVEELQADDKVERQVDEERRAKAHQDWLDMQDQDDLREVMKGFESGWKRPRKDLNGALGDEDEGTDRSTRARLRARGMGDAWEDGGGVEGMSMYQHNDDGNLSDGDEEARYAVQRATHRDLAQQAESKAAFTAAMFDEDSKEIIGMIRNTGVLPRTAPHTGKSTKPLMRDPIMREPTRASGGAVAAPGGGLLPPRKASGSSFLGRAAGASQGALIRGASMTGGRSFVFGRDDSSSNFASAMGGEDTADGEGFDRENSRSRFGPGAGGLSRGASLGSAGAGGPVLARGASLFSLLSSGSSKGSQEEGGGAGPDAKHHAGALKAALKVNNSFAARAGGRR